MVVRADAHGGELLMLPTPREVIAAGGRSGAVNRSMEDELWHYFPTMMVIRKMRSRNPLRGFQVNLDFDPLLAKLLHHAPTRPLAITNLLHTLTTSTLSGPPTNLPYLTSILRSPRFLSGHTPTSFLSTHTFSPSAIEVLSPGAYTLVQDLPARPAVGKGIPHAGPMDEVAFRAANALVGNEPGTAGLEITLAGPELRFHAGAVVAVAGAAMELAVDGAPVGMWTRLVIAPGQRLKIGKTTGEGGCRAYLAVYGGLPGVAEYFGSRSTSPLVGIGGYQGRALAPGDLLAIVPEEEIPTAVRETPAAVPEGLRPRYTHAWALAAMVGPYAEGYITPDSLEMIHTTAWKVSHNASRGGIRLIGPVPAFARADGGEGGAHPSNVVEYGYPLGTLNWTGDEGCIFPVDAPNFGGFVSSTTIVRADWWMLGQVRAGDTLRYVRVGLEDALERRRMVDKYVEGVERVLRGEGEWSKVRVLDYSETPRSTREGTWGKAVVWEREREGNRPRVVYRQGGDDHLIVEYGEGKFDLNNRCRVTALDKALAESTGAINFSTGLVNTVGCCNSLMIFYDGRKIPRADLIAHLRSLDDRLGDLSTSRVACRRFRLPISFTSKAQEEAIARYMETQRPHAPYLPDNLAFVARNNGLTPAALKQLYLSHEFMTVVVGFFCGNTVSLPVDPRARLACPKINPSRVYTPAGTVSWGGSCMSIYPVDSPGGYQMTGRTVPCFDLLGSKAGFAPTRPWLFEDFDLLTYYEVSEAQMEECLARFRRGTFVFEWEPAEFDMAAHNALLASTAEEVRGIRARQALAQDEMVRAENESLARWRAEKAQSQIDPGALDALLNDPNVEEIPAPLDANVWKVEVSEGDVLKADQVAVILEAMKLEIAVRVPEDLVGTRIEKMLVKPGDTVTAGQKLLLAKKA